MGILDRISAWRVTGFPLVPTLAAMLLQRDLSKYDLSSLRYLTNAGAALTTDAMTRLRRELPHVDLFSMYGLTECLRVSYLSPDEVERRPASVGKAMPNCEVCIVDESGEPVAANHVGELVVSGPHVMPGYWNDPEASAKRLKTRGSSGEKWLFTGDLFRMDADGFLYWVSRMDDVIKSRGEKVSPREVEEVLLLMPGVAEAVVYGVPDAVLGQAVQATLQLQPDSEMTTRDVQAHCRHYLEDFMVPQCVEFRESLPRTLNGKVDKRQLVEC
jgi:acyl-CoA synthetase (AMP-forming)/AMP-acid ligase II